MATHTKFRTFSSIELLNTVQAAREHSPVIEELAQRLEAYVVAVGEASATASHCPCCEALITLEFNNQGVLNVKLA